MKVELKIWRYDASTGDRALKPYEVDVSDEATLLDTLDVVKDKVDGTLAYRKSCRMMICGSCGMRVDGGAVLACKTRMMDIVEDGHVPVISAMGNLPIVKDLVVDMDPFWQKMQAVKPYLEPRLDRATDKENIVTQERMDVIHKESRGAHSRPSDFPDRDDVNFMKHSIIEWVDGAPRLSYRDVRVTKWEPTVRTY